MFIDALEKAMAAVGYLTVIGGSSSVKVHLWMAEAQVAPVSNEDTRVGASSVLYGSETCAFPRNTVRPNSLENFVLDKQQFCISMDQN